MCLESPTTNKRKKKSLQLLQLQFAANGFLSSDFLNSKCNPRPHLFSNISYEDTRESHKTQSSVSYQGIHSQLLNFWLHFSSIMDKQIHVNIWLCFEGPLCLFCSKYPVYANSRECAHLHGERDYGNRGICQKTGKYFLKVFEVCKTF